MLRHFICLIVLIAITCEGYSECQAQIVRRIIERRAAAREAAAEIAREGAEAPAADADPSTAATLRARRAARAAAREEQAADTPNQDAPPFAGQRPDSRPDPDSGVNQASAAFAAGTPVIPTDRDLAAMEISGLARLLHEWNYQLALDLENFTTAESWQRYLLLPEGVIDLGAIQPDGLILLQTRYDKVADNPRFEQISSLPSFDATHRVLQRLGAEVNGPQLLDAAGSAVLSGQSREQAEEVLPLPEPSNSPVRPRGERSILIRD